MAFGLRFGPPIVHPNPIAEGNRPEVIAIRKEPDDKAAVGENRHTDTTCLERPPLASALYAIEVPPAGGDTLFADRQGAWDLLSDGMKDALCDALGRPVDLVEFRAVRNTRLRASTNKARKLVHAA